MLIYINILFHINYIKLNWMLSYITYIYVVAPETVFKFL